MGAIADTLRSSLRELAKSDARQLRELDELLADVPPATGRRRLPSATAIQQAITLLEGAGYTVIPPQG